MLNFLIPRQEQLSVQEETAQLQTAFNSLKDMISEKKNKLQEEIKSYESEELCR